MKKFLILALCFLSACSQNIQLPKPELPIPVSESVTGFVNTVQVYAGDTYSKEDVGLVMVTFYSLWAENFKDKDNKVFKAFENLAIVWMPRSWRIPNVSAYDETGNDAGDENGIMVVGLAHEGAVIFVSKGNGNIWETSLVHELTHIALKASTGSGDPDHLGDKYPGWTTKHSELINFTNTLIEYVYTDESAANFKDFFLEAMED